jgi:hypothetical protein
MPLMRAEKPKNTGNQGARLAASGGFRRRGGAALNLASQNGFIISGLSSFNLSEPDNDDGNDCRA